jgi:hypothetical protein
MVYWNVGSILVSTFDAVIRPSQFVTAETSVYSATIRSRLRQFVRLLLVYGMNLLLYAVPLSLAGVGVPETAQAPVPFVEMVETAALDPDTMWRLTQAVLSNSAYITAAAGLTFVTFHVGALITLNSSGFLQSLHTVVYSTSAYLAGLFTTVWYLSTNEGVVAAREFVLAMQKAFVYWVIDLLGADLGLPGGRPDGITAVGLTDQGSYLLAVILVLLGYYIYSLYLGARINHDMSRIAALVSVLFVSVSPVVYVGGSVLASILGVV